MRKILAAFLALLPLGASAAEPTLWQHVSESSITANAERPATGPKVYKTLRLNQDLLAQLLAKAPLEFTKAARERELIITLPTPDGGFARFRIEESPMASPQVAAQVPEWKTYAGRGIDDPTAVLRFSWSANGLSAMVLGADGTYYVEPYSKADRAHYKVFHRRDAGGERGSFHCALDEYLADKQSDRTSAAATTSDGGGHTRAAALANGGNLKTYRLAVATTGEYTVERGGQQSALNDVMNAVNRINAVYRRDASVTFMLVSDARSVHPDALTDPYDNTDSEAQLTTNQTQLDTLYGNGSYDIGHLFGTGGGGVALSPSVCSDADKAQGYSARVPATGDPFWVDYVAHEIGHQLSAQHTYNTLEGGTCSTRSEQDAYEPASGSTIMSYVGICGDRNLQKDAIDGFHVRSLDQIIGYVNSDQGGCGTNTATGNNAPTVNAGGNFTIPKQTPFALRATATDANSDALSYSWEEFDLAAAASGPSAGGAYDVDSDGALRPLFRVYAPANNPVRNFPSLPFILNNANNPPQTFTGTSPTGAVCEQGVTCVTGETLPAVARTMNFRVVVRDNKGGTSDGAMQVNVDAAAGPFVVTAPNTGVSFTGGTQQTVTWDVANTNAGAVNAANVKISLSSDGGNTFPFVLSASTANDGSESVTMPNISSTTARIKVEAVGNIFFDISDANFTITGTGTAERTLLANIATRMRVETGENALIGGIIITGSQPKKVVIRAIGPSLEAAGISGALQDPQLQLFDENQQELAVNNNWRDAANQQEIIDNQIAPGNDLESAILTTLQPGNYTAVVRGVDNSVGIGLAEIYDLDRTAESKLANISTRGIVRADPNVMIGGFIIVGQTTQRVIIRAIGPSLPLEGKLADPTLDLVDNNGTVVRSNNNWKQDQQGEIEATGVPPPDEAEAAIVETLAPAPYTAVVRGAGETTGIALVEIYAL